ncbi:MAG: hypothetical protein IKX20_03230, partial [Paludibacteraceae bacterium]|nr:hypothetical protein [Paludibacteraceae bacterium]
IHLGDVGIELVFRIAADAAVSSHAQLCRVRFPWLDNGYMGALGYVLDLGHSVFNLLQRHTIAGLFPNSYHQTQRKNRTGIGQKAIIFHGGTEPLSQLPLNGFRFDPG